MIITDITKTKAGRYSLFIDGKFLFSVELITLNDFSLKKGMEITEEELIELEEATKEKKVRAKAYSLLSQRSYSSKKLAEKITAVGGKNLALEVVEELEERGFVDDNDYAERYAASLYDRKFFAPMRIKRELMEKGISREIAEEVSGNFEAADNVDRALLFIEKKRFDVTSEKGKKRAFDNLVRLGYSFSEARKAIGIYEEDYGN